MLKGIIIQLVVIGLVLGLLALFAFDDKRNRQRRKEADEAKKRQVGTTVDETADRE